MKSPIWLDKIFQFTSDDVRFRIVCEGEVIYEGRSKARPDELYATVNVNRICQNYLNNTIPQISWTMLDLGGGHYQTGAYNAYRTFILQQWVEGAQQWSTVDSYEFLYDWSYEDMDMEQTQTLNEPINDHYTMNQVSACTVYNATSGSVVNHFQLVDGNYCGEYYMVYLNARGGWDSFLFEGFCKKSDQYSRFNLTKNGNSGTQQFSKTDYLNTITEKWELNTGWLSDDESERFVKNLISSIQCYLVNPKTNETIPVVITETSAGYKRYMVDNQESPINYKITVESSRNKLRY